MIPDIGVSNGIMSVILNYAKGMPEDIKFDVVYFAEKEKDRKSDIEALGGRVYKIDSPSVSSELTGSVKAFMREHRGEWDVLHINAPHFAVFIAPYAKTAKIKKVCVHCHSTEFSLKGNSNRNKLLSGYSKHFIKDKFACSENAGRFWYGDKSFTVLKNAIDCKGFEFNPELRLEKRNELGIDDELVIAHIGRTDIPQKNHSFILKVFGEICKLNSKSKLLLIGAEENGELSELCEELGIKEKVCFLGSRGDVAELLQASDVFLFPSTSEGLPVSVVEAQASGLPVLMSDVITDEVAVLDTLCTLPLSEPYANWAEKCIELSKLKRTAAYVSMAESGWDISTACQKLIDYYRS